MKTIGLRLLALLIWVAPAGAADMSGEDIIRKLESQQVFDSAFVRGKMVINDRFGEKISTFESWSLGADYSLILFTSADEQGQKVLRSHDDLYLYFPEAEEVIRLSGSALRDSLLGSDLSYEDMTGDKSLLDSYQVTETTQETLDGLSVYRIKLSALRPSVAYPTQELWIDATQFSTIKAHKYSLNGKLLKVQTVLALSEQAGYRFATHSRIEDHLKGNSATDFYIDTIEVDTPLTPDFFSIQELTW
jgi:hypothetical protein